MVIDKYINDALDSFGHYREQIEHRYEDVRDLVEKAVFADTNKTELLNICKAVMHIAVDENMYLEDYDEYDILKIADFFKNA